jgi:hypothetical protein
MVCEMRFPLDAVVAHKVSVLLPQKRTTAYQLQSKSATTADQQPKKRQTITSGDAKSMLHKRQSLKLIESWVPLERRTLVHYYRNATTKVVPSCIGPLC